MPWPPLAQTAPIASVCKNPYQDAHAISAVNPQLPASARNLRGTVIVLVELTLGSDGRLKDATIYKSSGNAEIDKEALKAAHATVYAPKLVNCVPTDANVLFRADFQGSPLTPPTISVPPGWQPGRFNDNSQYAMLSWSDAPQHQFILHWQLDSHSLDDVRKMESTGPLAARRVEDVRLCNGTQPGIRALHDPTGPQDRSPSGVIEVILANGVMYTASFLAYDHVPPGTDVRKALDSFCAPATP